MPNKIKSGDIVAHVGNASILFRVVEVKKGGWVSVESLDGKDRNPRARSGMFQLVTD